MIVSPTEITAVVYDLQRLSLNDGPGIRTTVFLKGCPLSCAWCHNPESWDAKPILAYTEALCRYCGECERVCPTGAHSFNPAHRIDRKKCDSCGKCVEACPFGALELCGKEYTVAQLLKKLEVDRPYYKIGDADGNGGGVTLSGGEPMASFGFIKAFLEKKKDLHVCLETSGYAPSDQFEQIASMVDLFLFDWKASSPAKHRRLCGVDNELISANLRLLCRQGAKVLLRLPLVPGVNDDEDHIRSTGALLAELPEIIGAQIMSYHSLGSAKEARFGLDGQTLDQKSATLEQGAQWLKAFHAIGARNVYI